MKNEEERSTGRGGRLQAHTRPCGHPAKPPSHPPYPSNSAFLLLPSVFLSFFPTSTHTHARRAGAAVAAAYRGHGGGARGACGVPALTPGHCAMATARGRRGSGSFDLRCGSKMCGCDGLLRSGARYRDRRVDGTNSRDERGFSGKPGRSAALDGRKGAGPVSARPPQPPRPPWHPKTAVSAISAPELTTQAGAPGVHADARSPKLALQGFTVSDRLAAKNRG